MTQILDPADRLRDRGLVAMLSTRYDDLSLAEVPDFAERYGNVCDLVVQLLWPEKYGTGPGDPYQHTSSPAREIARLVFIAAGLGGPGDVSEGPKNSPNSTGLTQQPSSGPENGPNNTVASGNRKDSR